MFSIIKGAEDVKISSDSIAKALRITIDSNVNIINISIGNYKENKKVEELIKVVIDKNIIVGAIGEIKKEFSF